MMKNFHKLLLLLALLLSGQRPAGAQVVEWAKVIRNDITNSAAELGATTDPDGNTYAVGTGLGSMFPANGEYRIVKYDSTSRVVWTKITRNVFFFIVGHGHSSNLLADPVGGGFFVMGALGEGATWDGVPVPGSTPRGGIFSKPCFYGKCAANGTLLWVRPLHGFEYSPPQLAVDGLGNCYLTGFDTHNYPKGLAGDMGGKAIDSTTAFLVGNNAAGTAEWVRRIKATPVPRTGYQYYELGNPAGVDLRLGSSAGAGFLLFGTFNKELLLEDAAGNWVPLLTARPGAAPASTSYDDFMASLTPTGTVTWIRPARVGQTAGGPPEPSVMAAYADAAGNYYATGYSGAQNASAATGHNNPTIPGWDGSGFGTAKYGPAGNLLWTTNQQAYGGSYVKGFGRTLVVDKAGEVTVQVDMFSYPDPSLPSLTIGNLVLTDKHSVIHFDAAGVPKWATAIRSARAATSKTYSYNDPVVLDVDAKGNIYYTISASTIAQNSQVTGNWGLAPAVSLAGEHTVVGSGTLTARIGTRHNTVRGRVYLDANGNGQRDSGEGAFPQQTVLQVIQPTYAPLGTFDTSGDFNVYAGPGSYSLAPPPAPLHYALTEPANGAPYTGSFTGFGHIDTARIFGYRPLADQTDLRVTLTPYGAARPGFLARYRLTLDNIGTTTIPAGTAAITLDSHSQFVSSTPAESSVAGSVVQVPYPAVAKFSRTQIDVLFSLPVNTSLGMVLNSSAAAPLASDVAPADNSATAQQIVTGSFDPNDIEVNYQRLTPTQLAAGLPLDYTIRFQNMGTDTAFTVVLHDTLDGRKFNLKSLKLVAQSHNCQWSLSGTGQLMVRFLDIKLPHRSVDVIRSQGFVRFRVQPLPTLEVGTVIPNRASIVFDYNQPVRTNQATTAVFMPTAISANQAALAWSLYPNPATEQLTVTAEVTKTGLVQLALLDALGRTVQRHALTAPAGPLRQTMDLQAVTPGVYLLRLQLPDGTVSSQRVVRQ